MIRHGVRSGLSAGQAAASLRPIFSYNFLTTVHVPMLQNPGIAPFSGRIKIDRPVWSQIFSAPGQLLARSLQRRVCSYNVPVPDVKAQSCRKRGCADAGSRMSARGTGRMAPAYWDGAAGSTGKTSRWTPPRRWPQKRRSSETRARPRQRHRPTRSRSTGLRRRAPRAGCPTGTATPRPAAPPE